MAAISAAIISGTKYTSVYDYTSGSWINVDAAVLNGQVKAYDYSRGAHIEGELPSGVYDYGDGSFYELKLKSADVVDGYHYGSGSFFEAKVNGRAVEIYDYGAAGFYSFEVS